MKQVVSLIIAIMIFLPGLAMADGKSSYGVCIACHGANGEGNPALNSPAIAGQEAWYLEIQLKNFKSGARGTHKDDMYGMQMRPMAMMLTDDSAIAEIAEYISGMAPAKIEDTGKGDAGAGKNAYIICASCHGNDGKGLKTMNAPNLTLQQDWYVIRQLQNYKSGVRGTDPSDILGMQMRPMSMTLSNDKAIEDVAAYISTLR